MKKYAIIVAGGLGTRMGSKTPKQFLLINDKPIIVETVLKFFTNDPEISLIVVIPQNHLEHWNQLKEKFLKDISIKVTIGGATRTDSVGKGLSMIEGEEGVVAIHDAVRPFVEDETINQSFDSAIKYGSGVACVPLKDSIRELKGKDTVSRNRSDFVLVQTPQTFKVNEIKRAYKMLARESLTDDASVYEKAGFKVNIVDGSYSNIKITTPDDLEKF